MTPSELKQKVSVHSPHFFTRKTMRCFGDTMANYGVRSTQLPGHEKSVWELYRKRPVKFRVQSSTYFDKDTYTRIRRPINP